MAGGNVEDAFRCSAPPNANTFHAETAQPVFAAFVVIVPSQFTRRCILSDDAVRCAGGIQNGIRFKYKMYLNIE